MNGNRIFVSALLVIASSLAVAGCRHGNWTKSNIVESQARGNRIVAALDQYKAQNGKYPDSLALLLSGFLGEIEPPLAGNQVWRYAALKDGEDFELGFEGAADEPTCWYARSRKEWWLDTK